MVDRIEMNVLMPEPSERHDGRLPNNFGATRILPSVSVIIPVYNRAHLLLYALESIRNQTFKEWEVVIVDDGSVDNSYEIIKNFAASVMQDVSYFFQENQGVAVARNNGLNRIRSEYVAFLDSDDRWLENHIELLMKGVEANPNIDWICSDMQTISIDKLQILSKSKLINEPNYKKIKRLSHQNKNEIIIFKDKRLAEYLLRFGIFGQMSCSLIRRELFESMNFLEFRIAEDYCLTVRAAMAGFTLAIMEKVTVNFVVHDQHTTIGKNKSISTIIMIYSELIQVFNFLSKIDGMSLRQKMYLRMAVGRVYFWDIAYNSLWSKSERRKSLVYQIKGLSIWPFSVKCWKTFFICILRYLFKSL
jgi:glycosyltransferase involved in cell wall biosynthesis